MSGTRLDKFKGAKDQGKVYDHLTSDGDDRPVALSLKIPKREKDRLMELVKDINAKDRPIGKVTQTSVLIAALQLFEKQREKQGYNKLISQL